MRRVVALFAFVSALTGFFAPPAAAMPTFPSVAPYEGCTDWTLRYMTPDDPQWTFSCAEIGVDDYGSTWERYEEFYWNADSSQVMWFASTLWFDGWYWYCNLYPSGIGACDA